MEDLDKARKIRVSYSDPDATDSSSAEEEEEEDPDNNKLSKRKIHEIVLEKHSKILASSSSHQGIIRSGSSSVDRYVGAYRRRSGRYSSEIKDPFSKKRVWLGTFNTAEEAHLAYISSKIKIQEGLIARAKRGRASAKQDSPSSVLEQNEINTTTSDSSNAEENNNNNNNNNKVAAVSEERFGFLCGVQVVDRNGFLVGKFSELDDLSICSEDGTFYCQEDRVMLRFDDVDNNKPTIL